MAAIRFSVFELDQSSGELTRAGRRVGIAPQPFKVLWCLASRPGQVVSREELRQLLWGDHTHVDFDRSLNFCIAAVRRSLGDSARQPRFVETLPQRGYRFIAEVRQIDVNAPVALPPPTSGAPAVPPASRWRRLAAIAALPLLLAQQPATPSVHTRLTANPAARSAFDRGEALWPEGAAAWRQRMDAFAEAARLDDRFAEAHYALAVTYAGLADRRALPQQDALGLAKAEVERAVDLEDAPESRRLLGTLRLVRDWDWVGARRDLMRAVDLEPTAALVLVDYAKFLSAAGDDAAALQAIARAVDLSPSCDLLRYEAALLQYRARRYTAALASLDAARRLGPPSDRSAVDWLEQVHVLGLLIRLQQQDWEAARAEAVAVARLRPAADAATDLLASVPARQAVEIFLDRSLERYRPRIVRGEGGVTRLARMAALAGREDEAMAWLERAVGDRDGDVVYALRDPAFDTLRSQVRFASLEATVAGRSSSPASSSLLR